MNKILNNSKGFALLCFAISFTTTLFGTGTIQKAKSKQDACNLLKKMYANDKKNHTETMTFTDIGNTLISNKADFDSYAKNRTFVDVQPVNCELIEMLQDIHLGGQKIFGATSARTHCPKIEGNTVQIVPGNIQGTPASVVRAMALQSLGMYFTSLGQGHTIFLPYLTSSFPVGDDGSAKCIPFTLSQYKTPSNVKFFMRPKPVSTPTMPMPEYHLCSREDRDGQAIWKEIVAFPVFENGIIFSNFLDQRYAWQKGLVIYSFLNFLFERFPARRNVHIIAIDSEERVLMNIKHWLGRCRYPVSFSCILLDWVQ
ncbi:MAG: hypothetical protein LBB11_01740 [Puniceicoccales bacterium]|jgi:hypothetical protein|nr:hypothetical protein [Puniceicoccales bacterium]